MLRDSAILDQKLRRRLLVAGSDFDSLLKDADEIVVFGSCTTGLDRRDSDIDVLVSGGPHAPQKYRDIDLVFIDVGQLRSEQWLGSELASHVVRYGVWLRGEGCWRSLVRIDTSAKTQKVNRIERLASALFLRWNALHPIFRDRYRITVRREIQRLVLLREEIPIPPSRLLDRLWNCNREHRLTAAQCVETMSLPPQQIKFLANLTEPRTGLFNNRQRAQRTGSISWALRA